MHRVLERLAPGEGEVELKYEPWASKDLLSLYL